MPPKAYKRPYRRNYKKKYVPKKKFAPRTVRGTRALVKREVMKLAETKYTFRDVREGYWWNGLTSQAFNTTTEGNVICYHNRPMFFELINNTSGSSPLMPTQGLTDAQRIGDEIQALSMKLRIQFESDSQYHNIVFKIYTWEFNTQQIGSLSTVDPGTVFHQITGCNIIDPIQTDRVTLKLLGTVRMKARDVATNYPATHWFVKSVPFKRNLKFQNDDTTRISKGMKELFGLYIVPYVNASTPSILGQGTPVGNVRISTQFFYKDL